MLNRRQQPDICQPERIDVPRPRPVIMPNGVPVHVLNIGDSEVVRIDVLMAGGRWRQSYPLQALFTNRMLREGTRRFTTAQIAEKLDYYGAWLEFSNAPEYAFVTLHSLNKYLPQTLEILESIIKEPTFPEKELGVIAENNRQQFLVNSSKVDFLAHRALSKALYGTAGHPCGQLVKEEDYRHVNAAMLRTFYDDYYHSANCMLYLSGKVSDECLQRIERIFGASPFGKAGRPAERKHFIPSSCDEKRIFVERSDAMQSAVRLGMLTLEHTHPDFLKLRVLTTLFGGYFGSRLMANIREEKGYTYGIQAGIVTYPDSGMFVIHAETANETVEPLIEEVYHEIDKLQNEPVSLSELRIVQNYMLGELCRSCDSPFSLADAWIFIRTNGLDEHYYHRMLEAIKGITPEEVRLLAQRYLCKERLKEVVCGKKKS